MPDPQLETPSLKLKHRKMGGDKGGRCMVVPTKTRQCGQRGVLEKRTKGVGEKRVIERGRKEVRTEGGQKESSNQKEEKGLSEKGKPNLSMVLGGVSEINTRTYSGERRATLAHNKQFHTRKKTGGERGKKKKIHELPGSSRMGHRGKNGQCSGKLGEAEANLRTREKFPLVSILPEKKVEQRGGYTRLKKPSVNQALQYTDGNSVTAEGDWGLLQHNCSYVLDKSQT